MKHLYVGDAQTNLVRAFCGWPNIARRNTTADWKWVTCSLCLGRRNGLTLKALNDTKPKSVDAQTVTELAEKAWQV